MAASDSSISPARAGFPDRTPIGEEDNPRTDGHDTNEQPDPHIWSKLQEGILEKVVARLPLKYMLQARLFSKDWNAKIFSPAFEKEVRSVSSAWPTYCPLYMMFDSFVGFDGLADGWQKIFTHYIAHVPGSVSPYIKSAGAGSLVCIVCEDEELKVETMYDRRWIDGLRSTYYDLFVTNVVTRKTRQLPPRPNMECPHMMHVLLPVGGGNSYKIILVTQLGLPRTVPVEAPICTQIYDSASNSWTMKIVFALFSLVDIDDYSYVYLDAVFYIVVVDKMEASSSYRIVAYNVERGTWVSTGPHPLPHSGFSCKLYLCRNDVMLLLVNTAGMVNNLEASLTETTDKFYILKLDVVALQVSKVTRGPPDLFIGARFDRAAAFGDCIYFGGIDVSESALLVYNVRQQEWSRHSPAFEKSLCRVWKGAPFTNRCMHFPWANFALQPGLNPFVEV